MAPEPVGIVNGMARNQQTDVPAIVLHALIGNVRPTVLFLCHIWTWLTLVLAQQDVCNGHPGLGSMTTVAKFGAAVNKSLDYLEATLPPGSTVILIGLVGQDPVDSSYRR